MGASVQERGQELYAQTAPRARARYTGKFELDDVSLGHVLRAGNLRQLKQGCLLCAPLLPVPVTVGASMPCLTQDVLACLLLSEAVYKAAEGPPSTAVAAVNALLAAMQAALPPGAAPQVPAVQFSRRGAQHRYLIARGRDALYLSFMGSKQPRDLLSDANVLTALVWGTETAAEAAQAASEPAAGAIAAAAEAAAATAAATAPELAGVAAAGAPAAHRGFLWRSQGVPVEALLMHARRQGLRLVLCGKAAWQQHAVKDLGV